MTDQRGSTLTIEQANEFRRAVGEAVRIIRLGENTPDGQIETLGFLAREGSLSIADLARRRRVRHQSMSAMVAELERRGLAAREADPDDARGVLVSLTTAGHEMIRESRIRRSTRILTAAETVLTPRERGMLGLMTDVLDKLTEALRDG
ncbi:MarR family winged helix-turn-helix transcriptional regulator [Frondihabitans cladoniiphilus]|uniref:HTH marR-type domain-containing protein n=1 Tax=Frondihabitans cladoniiphilus TaxID=715785 RepID=A0ABP8VXF9_9MICO